MSKEDYRQILVWAIKNQLVDVEQDITENEENESIVGSERGQYLYGVKRGLEIALEKLEASKFLTEKEEDK